MSLDKDMYRQANGADAPEVQAGPLDRLDDVVHALINICADLHRERQAVPAASIADDSEFMNLLQEWGNARERPDGISERFYCAYLALCSYIDARNGTGAGPASLQPDGMALRDNFAAKFCAAMVSTIRNNDDYLRYRGIAEAHQLGSVSEFFAKESYKQADALLAERAK